MTLRPNVFPPLEAGPYPEVPVERLPVKADPTPPRAVVREMQSTAGGEVERTEAGIIVPALGISSSSGKGRWA